jgi:hypothetical protein
MTLLKNAIFWDVMLCGALVGTDISEERIASIIRVEKISQLGTALVVTIHTFLQSVDSYKNHMLSHSRRGYSS